jgi:hypothetical protein
MKKNILVLLFSALTIFIVSACTITIPVNVNQGSGKVVTESRDVSNFSKVSLLGIGELEISVGSSESLKIEAEENIIQKIKTEVKGDTLEISFEDHFNIMPTKPIRFLLTVKQLTGIEVSGAGNVKLADLQSDALDVVLNGAGNISASGLQLGHLDVELNGAGSFEVSGKITDQTVTLGGAGSYQAKDLESTSAKVTLSGAGSATLWVTGSLDAKLSGVGSLDYYGSPAKVSQDISGLGSINDKGAK